MILILELILYFNYIYVCIIKYYTIMLRYYYIIFLNQLPLRLNVNFDTIHLIILLLFFTKIVRCIKFNFHLKKNRTN